MEPIIFNVNHKVKELAFGKYKGWSLSYVISNNPNYIKWCIENVSGFELTKEENNELKKSLYKQRTSCYERCPSGEAGCDEWESWAWGGAVSPWGADFM